MLPLGTVSGGFGALGSLQSETKERASNFTLARAGLRARSRCRQRRVKIAPPATGAYAWHLAIFLTGFEGLKPSERRVFLLQPRAVKLCP